MTEAKRLTATELKDIYERMADADADALEAHLSALTPPTPEEVARSYARVLKTLEEAGKAEEDCCDRCNYRALDTEAVESLTILRDGAARAQALEKTLEDAKRFHSNEYKDRQSAESERDAARQEAEKCRLDLEDVRTALAHERATVDHLNTEAASLRSRVATLERENGLLRADAEAALLKLEHTIARAEAAERRVAELEAHNRILETQRDSMQLERNRALDYQRILRARFDTARSDALEEAAIRVDVEAQESHTREAAALLDDVAARIRALKATPSTHPAPAGLLEAVGRILRVFQQAQGLWKPVHLSDGTIEMLRAAYDAAKGGAPSVAGMSNVQAGDVVLDLMAEKDAAVEKAKASESDDRKYREACERARNAYEVHNHAVTAYLDARDARKAIGVDVAPVVAKAVLSYVLGLDGATPPRETLDKARVVEVLISCVKEYETRTAESDRVVTPALGRPYRIGSDSLSQSLQGAIEGVREVAKRLGLTLDTPPSDKATCAPCARYRGASNPLVNGVCPSCGVVQPQPTPPSGPGGGEMTCCGEQGTCEDCPMPASNPPEFPDGSEARNPRVTPDGPPLANHSTPSKGSPAHVEPVTLGKGPFRMDPDVAARAVERTARSVAVAKPDVYEPTRPVPNCGHVNPEDGLCAHPRNLTPECHEHACPLVCAQPEPAAPELVLDRDGVRVLADGWWTHDGRHPSNISVAGILARALAEAKREITLLKAEVTEHLRAGMTARRAAEAMRERCATRAETAKHRTTIVDSTYFRAYSKACDDVAELIRVEPL